MTLSSLILSEVGLQEADNIRKAMHWRKDEPILAEKATVSVSTLRRFWSRTPLSYDCFTGICQALNLDPHAVGTTTTGIKLQRMDMAVLDSNWVGRETLVSDLVEQLKKSHRILLLLGMTGIGKTALAESLVIQLRGSAGFDELRENWESDRPQDFATVATNWLQGWGIDITPELQQNSELLFNQVLEKLCQEKHLLLFDSLEEMLTGSAEYGWGEFQDPLWRRFFQQILASPACQSRILVTSQSLPLQLQEDAVRYPNLWRSTVLSGLNPAEQTAFFQNFRLQDAAGQVDSRILQIGQVYDGHPLALRTIAGEIQTSYHGNITAYWHRNSSYIAEVLQDLQKAREQGQVEGREDRWRLDSYTIALRRQVGQQLERIFQRLQQEQPIAYELLCYASIYRCAVTQAAWLLHLEYENYAPDQQELALISLRDRFLVEDGGVDDADQLLVALHNLIRSKAITHRVQFFQAA